MDEGPATAAASAGAGAPRILDVRSPHEKRCTGRYELFPWETPNDQPLWKQKTGNCWLYSSNAGRWVIGGIEAKNKSFACSTGYIASCSSHEGAMPHKCNATWERAQWHEDPAICVTAEEPQGSCDGQQEGGRPHPPSLLRVVSPNGRQECSGEYVVVEGETPHGYPLWKHRDSDYWVYTGTKGSWLIGGIEERIDNFGCSSGVIVCGRPHNGDLPQSKGHRWFWNGRSLDSSIIVTAEGEDGSQAAWRLAAAKVVVLVCGALVLLLVISRSMASSRAIPPVAENSSAPLPNGNACAASGLGTGDSGPWLPAGLAESATIVTLLVLFALSGHGWNRLSALEREKEGETAALQEARKTLAAERSKVARLEQELAMERARNARLEDESGRRSVAHFGISSQGSDWDLSREVAE